MTERGAASVLAAVGIGLLLLFGSGVLGLGRLVVVKVEAQTAADAAALAAAVATWTEARPGEAAAQMAGRNGAELVRCSCSPDPSSAPRTVQVEVIRPVRVPVLGRIPVHAAARAEYRPPLELGGSLDGRGHPRAPGPAAGGSGLHSP